MPGLSINHEERESTRLNTTTPNVLLTGGSGGMGRAILERMPEGYSVLAPSRFELDMADPVEVVEFLFQQPYSRPAHVIFAHGTWTSRPVSDRPQPAFDPDWEYQYQERVIGPWTLVDMLLKRGGLESVTVVSSTRGLMGGADTAAYSTMCAAQLALVSGYARECPDVRFNAVAPALTATRMAEAVISTGGARPGAIPQDPGAVADAVIELMQSKKSGIILRVVDGQVSRMTWEAAPWK